MNEIIKINEHKIIAKEYMGQRVVTFKDIDVVHERPDGTARRNFNANKNTWLKMKIISYEIRTKQKQITELQLQTDLYCLQSLGISC